MFSPHALPTNTPREYCTSSGQAGAGDARAHSPWTAPRVRKKNKSCCSTLQEVAEELLEEPVRRKGTLSPAARELQPFFAEESDSSRECSPVRSSSTAYSSGVAPFGVPAVCESSTCSTPPMSEDAAQPMLGERLFAAANNTCSISPASSSGDVQIGSGMVLGRTGGAGQFSPFGDCLRIDVPADCSATAAADGVQRMDVHDSVASLPSPSGFGYCSSGKSAAPKAPLFGGNGCRSCCGGGDDSPFALAGARLRASPCWGSAAAAPSPASSSRADAKERAMEEDVSGGGARAASPAAAAAAGGAAEPSSDIDALNALLRCMCRVSADPEEAEQLVADYCSDTGVAPNASTLCYLSALWTQQEQLSAS